MTTQKGFGCLVKRSGGTSVDDQGGGGEEHGNIDERMDGGAIYFY